MKKLLTLIAIAALLPLALANSGRVSLAWDAPEPGCTFRVYAHSASITITNIDSAFRFDAGTNTTYTIYGLANGVRWYFVATAVLDGMESDPSNEVSVRGPNPPPFLRKVLEQ